MKGYQESFPSILYLYLVTIPVGLIFFIVTIFVLLEPNGFWKLLGLLIVFMVELLTLATVIDGKLVKENIPYLLAGISVILVLLVFIGSWLALAAGVFFLILLLTLFIVKDL